MIKGTFSFGGDNSEVIIKGNELLFFDVSSGMMTSLEGLKLNRKGTIKEFPDLDGNPEWKKIAIERIKENMKLFQGERERLYYVKEELEKFGYNPMFYQRAGFRPQKFKDGNKE